MNRCGAVRHWVAQLPREPHMIHTTLHGSAPASVVWRQRPNPAASTPCLCDPGQPPRAVPFPHPASTPRRNPRPTATPRHRSELGMRPRPSTPRGLRTLLLAFTSPPALTNLRTSFASPRRAATRIVGSSASCSGMPTALVKRYDGVADSSPSSRWNRSVMAPGRVLRRCSHCTHVPTVGWAPLPAQTSAWACAYGLILPTRSGATHAQPCAHGSGTQRANARANARAPWQDAESCAAHEPPPLNHTCAVPVTAREPAARGWQAGWVAPCVVAVVGDPRAHTSTTCDAADWGCFPVERRLQRRASSCTSGGRLRAKRRGHHTCGSCAIALQAVSVVQNRRLRLAKRRPMSCT